MSSLPLFDKPDNVLIVSVEGNIGSGKSTFVNKLREEFEEKKYKIWDMYKKGMLAKEDTNICVEFVDEPVDEWKTIRDETGCDILTRFYENVKRYSFTFQMMAYISRLTKIAEKLHDAEKYPENKVILVTERSNYTDCEVFAKMLYDANMIEQIEYSVYRKWFDTFAQLIKPDYYLYLHCEPAVSYDRVMTRAREGEKISLEYLTNCNKYHNDWLSNIEHVKHIDASNDADAIYAQGLRYLEEIIVERGRNHYYTSSWDE